MKRNVIKIDEYKCVGCGSCASACHQGAISIVDGKAKLMHENYCDGFGECLPVCPTGAISFEEREIETTVESDTVESDIVETDMEDIQPETLACGCPGTNSKTIERESASEEEPAKISSTRTHLNQWPIKIKLVPPNAPYFDKAKLLVAADCAAYAYGNFHEDYMKNRITLIGCPKLDEGDYSEKLTAILKQNDIKSVTVVRMEVPCCSGIVSAVTTALQNCGKMIPWQVVNISTDGRIVED